MAYCIFWDCTTNKEKLHGRKKVSLGRDNWWQKFGFFSQKQFISPHFERIAKEVGIGGFILQGKFLVPSENEAPNYTIDYISLIRPYIYLPGVIIKTYLGGKDIIPIKNISSDWKQAETITVALARSSKEFYTSVRMGEFKHTHFQDPLREFHSHIAFSVMNDPEKKVIDLQKLDIKSAQRWVSYRLMTDYLRTTRSDVQR